jgi:lipopolysaccharide export system permease protein
MEVEGFDFERSQSEAFSRSDRELSAQAMQVIVDSLRQVRVVKRERLVKTIADDIDEKLSAGTDTTAAPALTLGGRTTPGPLNRSRSISSNIQNESAQIGFLGKQINQYLVEIHKKYSIPAACLVFVIIGLPLGAMVRKGGFGVAASLSLGFFVLYWACLIGGEKLADRGIFSPFWGMWIANFLIGGLGFYLLIKTSRETVIVNLAALIPRRWQPRRTDDTEPT